MTDSVRREYPTRRQASQLLGYTDFTNSGSDGAGIERQYDNILTGRPGERLEVQGPDGLPLDTITLRRPRPGRDVQLTINRAIQAKVQSVLDGTVQQFRAHSATAIVLDPKTGEILAMASSPGYDNNEVHDLPARRFHDATQNMAVEYSYEPGSTFKVVTMAAALTDHIVYPWTKFNNLPYQIQVGDKVVHDDVPRGSKDFTVRQILQESSNVGTVTIARLAGRTLLSKWIDRFGFGHTTGVDLPGEAPGILLPPDKWYDSSIGNIPIGQGIAVTPMQMAAMYSAIANGGVLVQPHVVKRIEGEPKPDVSSRRILDAGIDRQLVNMLKGVVDTATGTGVRARIPGYTVAGKTGTAQKALAHGLGYSTRNYVASFVGFLPADDPQVEVLVVVDSPRGNIFGGYVAAPAFKDIATSLTQLLAIPPDRRIPAVGGHVEPARYASRRMRLANLISALEPLEVRGGTSGEIAALSYDASRSEPGALHFCVPGLRADGHDFAAVAAERGAVALVVERFVDVRAAAAAGGVVAVGDGAGCRRLLRPSQRHGWTWSASPAPTARRPPPS